MEEDIQEAWKLSAERRPVGDRKRNVRVEAEHWQLQEQGESVPRARTLTPTSLVPAIVNSSIWIFRTITTLQYYHHDLKAYRNHCDLRLSSSAQSGI
jgi:hypothetical protein